MMRKRVVAVILSGVLLSPVVADNPWKDLRLDLLPLFSDAAGYGSVIDSTPHESSTGMRYAGTVDVPAATFDELSHSYFTSNFPGIVKLDSMTYHAPIDSNPASLEIALDVTEAFPVPAGINNVQVGSIRSSTNPDRGFPLVLDNFYLLQVPQPGSLQSSHGWNGGAPLHEQDWNLPGWYQWEAWSQASFLPDAVALKASPSVGPFVRWAGTATDLGFVANPTSPDTEVRVRDYFQASSTQCYLRPVYALLPESTECGWGFDFSVTDLSDPVYIDPAVAIGYDYFVDSGPSFSAVVLPSVGDNLYDLWLWDGLTNSWMDSSVDITGGLKYDFATGAVDRFRILGIEASAGLDPTDVTAFVTGLWFTGTGPVTMRQVPVSFDTSVPAPSALVLVSIGLAGLHAVRRRLG